MTIQEYTILCQRTMANFVNPHKKPLEDLTIKYISNDSSYEEFIPALDPKWCNKDYVFTLFTHPPSKNVDGKFTMGSKEDWLERTTLFIDDLNLLLQLEYYRFWSEVVHNKCCLDGLNSFLQKFPPFYSRDQIPQDKEIVKILKTAQELVFLLLIRLTQAKESEESWMKSSTLASILYNKFVISLPQLMEISQIYANDNFKEVTELVNRVFDMQPKYINDIKKSTSFVFEVFSKLENQLCPSNEDNGGLPQITNYNGALSSVEVANIILLMLDISYSLATFLEVCPRAGNVFHEQQLEPRLAMFYGTTIPVLSRHLDLQYNSEETQEQYVNYKFQIDLSRHQFISSVHGCLTTYLSTILEERDELNKQELKNKVDNYLNTLSECLYDHVFIRDYNSAFPIQRDLRMLSEICPDIDSVKSEFIVESVAALYDAPPKSQKTEKPTAVPLEAGPSTDNVNNRTVAKNIEESSRKVTGVELHSLITEVKDILPHLGDGFISKCLEHFNFVSADVINAVLESTLPDSLTCLDPEMLLDPLKDTQERNGLPERINVFDNDEFDIMAHDKVDISRIHKGKRSDKHKNLLDMLDDKTHVNQLRDVYTQLSLVDCVENVDAYEDEYDDTYDDLDGAVGNEGETEINERRPFVIPRVLQQQHKKSVEDRSEYDNEEDEEEDEGRKEDLFIENPADIRARAEQRRLEMRGRGSGRPRAAFSQRDVVGKPKGQGQEKEVIRNREFKNSNKAFRGNHNRRTMADKKRRQGMFST